MAELTVRRLADFRSAPVGKVIKADAYSALVESDTAIAAIEKEAERLFEQTREAARKQALEEASAEIREQQLDAAAAAVEFLADLEEDLAKLVAEGMRRIIGEFEPTDAMLRMIQRLLVKLRTQNRIALHVGPDMLEAVNSRLSEIRRAHPAIEEIELSVDTGLSGTACRLETPLSMVQTSIDEQIEALCSALSASHPPRRGVQ